MAMSFEKAHVLPPVSGFAYIFLPLSRFAIAPILI